MYEIRLTITEAINAGIKESTLNPCQTDPANQNTRAFRINKNNPKVITVRGRVSRVRMGFTVTLRIPRIAEATIAALMLRMCMPGTKLATNKIAMVVMIHDIIKPLMANLLRVYW
jgi:hypothetical protein